ncbi:DUF1604 domain protein [Metarhizium album ARSEF 1941]|uniref:DUF1604 domain protein n=1 Tax=Metarhizium album (strain ARSEF 1941) TaxID=1081103 RepID=A0A0B2WSL3_METAS|nr:DUF1604 domain protein [Metarhizium album ARSEF 1941]KHN99061.1 DUF1604 domain protein [Metarhizium album ARSEF 1941]
MSYKRSRSTFEADLDAPYALFGTPLPHESDPRDHGSYLPLWKQDVRDEKGRRRLHGAFTGGWSAGYFNTVGSKEGWTPSTFVSSRSSRRKDEDDTKSTTMQQKAEAYMDEEDLEDAAEAQQLQTSRAFAGLGSSTQDEIRAVGLMGLFKPPGDTKGLHLLRRMGWKDGQGIGPKIRRGARLDVGKSGGAGLDDQTYLFAPDDAQMIKFVRKTDRMGLGHQGGTRLQSLEKTGDSDQDNDDDDTLGKSDRPSLFSAGKKEVKFQRGAFGVGVLNDTGSDEEDPYDIGPKIRYNRVMGGDKKKEKKRKKTTAAVNPSLQKAPVFLSKTVRAGNNLRRCHDGRLPLHGFVLAKVVEDLAAALSQYAPPPVPVGWKSSKDPLNVGDSSKYTSTADAAKVSTMDPRSRAVLLGENALPGKSVFDFISSSSRDKLAALSGNQSLPPGLGQLPEGHRPLSEDEKRQALWNQIPKLDQTTAAAALSRSPAGPYADDEVKRARYRKYLVSQANHGQDPPDKAPGATEEDYVREMNEFYNCARIFKPMTGFMASRFTTSKTVLHSSSNNSQKGDDKTSTDLLSKPEPKSRDAAEEAAMVGMFGRMTRSVEEFYPTRLLCKRFNVRAPAHAVPDREADNAASTANRSDNWTAPTQWSKSDPNTPVSAPRALEAPTSSGTATPVQQLVEVNPEKNDAVEGKAANADVLRAIFGDSDSE